VRGFPTMLFTGTDGQQVIVRGSKPYHDYETAILHLNTQAAKQAYDRSAGYLFEVYPSLTIREFAELAAYKREDAVSRLELLLLAGKLKKLSSKNGPLYYSYS
jgi:putative protein-disulfide isomerase